MPHPKRGGRPPTTYDNRFVRAWLYRRAGRDPAFPYEVTETPTIYSLPRWCGDCVVGAARLNGSARYTGKPLNTGRLIKILMALPTITNALVLELFEKKGAPISRQYGQQLTSAAISASKSIDYYLSKLELGETLTPALPVKDVSKSPIDTIQIVLPLRQAA